MVDHAQQGALARAARPHDHDHLAATDTEIDAVEDLPVAIGLLDVMADDDRPPGGSADILAKIADQRRQFLSRLGRPHRPARLLRPRPTLYPERRREPGKQAVAALAQKVEAPLGGDLADRHGTGHRQIDQCRRGEHREELEVLTDDLLGAEGQLVDHNDRGDRGALDHADRLIGNARQDRAHRLRHDDPAQGQPARHPKRRRRNRLAAADRQNAAADDLGAERRLVQRKSDDRGREGVELDADRRQYVIDEHQLQ